MQVQGFVNAPGNNADGATPVQVFGKQADGLVSEVHGKWYTAAYRGKLFQAGTAAAGITIPISSATAATFMIYNPIGSGVNIELARLTVGATNATLVVSPLLLGYASGLLVAPTGITALTNRASLIGGNGVAQAVVASAATITATTLFYTLFSVSATSGLGPNFVYDFDGTILLAPGSLVHLCGTAAQTQATAVSVTWAEWPV